ncbi:DDE-type integrase/transposase/recombinase [Myxococcus sp. SDU36]|nr:DDE-type integrase/transposase/recombinase [Myxococcus sp. SDU36]
MADAQARRNRPRRQLRLEPQPEQLSQLPHGQPLCRHLHLQIGRAEWPAAAQRRQRFCRPPTPHYEWCPASLECLLGIPGIGARHARNACSASPERLLTLLRNRCSAWPGIGARLAPEHAVVETVVPDNLKAAVLRAAFTPDVPSALNRSYREVARHYGFKVDPTPPYAPQKKGKVEAGVKYVQSSFFKGRQGQDVDVVRAELKEWLAEVANVRRHGPASGGRLPGGGIALAAAPAREALHPRRLEAHARPPGQPRPLREALLFGALAPGGQRRVAARHRRKPGGVRPGRPRRHPRPARHGPLRHPRGAPAPAPRRLAPPQPRLLGGARRTVGRGRPHLRARRLRLRRSPLSTARRAGHRHAPGRLPTRARPRRRPACPLLRHLRLRRPQESAAPGPRLAAAAPCPRGPRDVLPASAALRTQRGRVASPPRRASGVRN